MFKNTITKRSKIVLSFVLSSTLLVTACGDSPTLSRAELNQKNCTDIQSRMLELAQEKMWSGQAFTADSVDDIKAVTDGNGELIEPIQDVVDGSITHHCSARVNFSDGDQTYIRYYQSLDGLDVYYGAEAKDPPVQLNSNNNQGNGATSAVNLADIIKTRPYACFNWDQASASCDGMAHFELLTPSKAQVVADAVIEDEGSQYNLRIISIDRLDGNTQCSNIDDATIRVLPINYADQPIATEMQAALSQMLKGLGTEACDSYSMEGNQYRVDSFIDGEKLLEDELEYVRFMKSEPELRVAD